VSDCVRLIVLSILGLGLVVSGFSISHSPAHNQTMPIAQGLNASLPPVIGSRTTIVILVQFPDKANATSPPKISDMLIGLNSYYSEDSYGLVSFATTISPSTTTWYSLPQNMEYYSSNTASADSQLVEDSLTSAYNAGVNFHNYMDALVVHAGNDEAVTHVSTDIHSFTIPGYVFSPTPINSFQISTSVVSETDPVGVYCHEAGHLLGLPDLYDLTQRIDPTNNFVGYWEIMALGEWNPNSGNPLQPLPGTYPSQHSAWSKIRLGWISNSSIRLVYPGNMTTVTLQNLERPGGGVQAVKIPISVNSDGTLSYYLVEMRGKLGTYDQYLPFPSDYPSATLLIYDVNESIADGRGNLRLIDAHPGGDLNDAGFGPCFSPCVSNNTFWDPSSFAKIIVTSTNSTAYTILVDRTSSPLLLLQVNTPAAGITVSVDGTDSSSDQSRELRMPVHYGPHEVYVQAHVPVSLGATSIQLGLTDSFASWDDGNTANPRWVSVVKDTVLTATYRVTVEPSFATAVTAALILGVVAAGIAFNRMRQKRNSSAGVGFPSHRSQSQTIEAKNTTLFPGNNSLGGDSIKNDEKPNTTKA